MGGHKSLLMVMVWVWVQIQRKMLTAMMASDDEAVEGPVTDSLTG
jgi:hypothetical protein